MAIPLYSGPQDNSDLHKRFNDLIVAFNAANGTSVALFSGAQNVDNFLALLNTTINRLNASGALSPLILLVTGPQDAGESLRRINDLGILANARGGAAFPLSGAVVDVDFAGARVFGGTLANLFTITRASPAVTYAPNLAGVLIPFAPNTLRITDKGILIEAARTNIIKWSRDFTNVLWVATNIIAAKDQAGADGAAAAASSLTASAGLGTILQTTVDGSAAHFQTAYVKRITGTGIIEMTMDGGTTWTPITSLINSSTYTRVAIPSQTLANPVCGFRITTSGDAIAVDLIQAEAATTPSSPIPTTSTTVTRNAEVITIAGAADAAIKTATASVLIITPPQGYTPAGGARLIGSNSPVPIDCGSDTQAQVYNGTGFANGVIQYSGTYTQNTVYSAGSWGGGVTTAVANGGTPGTDAHNMAAITTAYLGSSNGSVMLNGFISRMVLWNTALSSAQLQSVSAPGGIFSPNAIVAWGNSLTSGNQDATGVTYPNVLGSLVGSTVYNQGIGGQTSTQILARFVAQTNAYGNPVIFEMGRNDFTVPNTVKANIATAVATQTSGKYLIGSILPSAADTGPQLVTLTTLNSDLATLYGTRFVDLLAILQANGNGSANDNADIAAGLTPRSLRSPGDNLHLNAAGYTIVAQAYYAKRALLGF